MGTIELPSIHLIAAIEGGVIVLLVICLLWLLGLLDDAMVEARRARKVVDALHEIERIGAHTRRKLQKATKR